MDMGQKIHNLRVEKGLTLEELGRLVGVGKSTVRKWENGIIANMRRDKILKVADALNTTPEYLMGWSSTEPSNVHSLRSDEKKLLSDYNILNKRGRDKVLEDIHNLTLLTAYTHMLKEDEPEYLTAKAAHERTDIDVTEDMRKHDDDIMRDF